MASKVSSIDATIHGNKSTLDVKLLSVAGLRNGGASKIAHVEVLLPQVVGDVAARASFVRDGGGARGRHVHKSQLTNDTAFGKNVSSPKHLLLRGRLPPNLGESTVAIQSFSGESVNVTAVVAARHHYVSDFDVVMYEPRTGHPVDNLMMVAYRPDLSHRFLQLDLG